MSAFPVEVIDPRRRPGAPSLQRIADYWRESDEFGCLFPFAAPLAIGWAEPCCFRCGWLAPIREVIAHQPAGWNAAGGWLQKCHLRDHARGGSMDLANLVPMCALCHTAQPECLTREDGISYVNSSTLSERKLAPFVQTYTDVHFAGRKLRENRDALRLMERAYAKVGQIYVQHLPVGTFA